MADPNALIRLTIAGKRMLTPGICEFTLEPADGATVQPFEPGAHLGVETPSGAMRQYSLVNDGRAPTRYVIALKREPESRGGSRSMVEDTAIGGTLRADAPANSFPLSHAAPLLPLAALSDCIDRSAGRLLGRDSSGPRFYQSWPAQAFDGCCSAWNLDLLEAKSVNGLERRSASNTHAEQHL